MNKWIITAVLILALAGVNAAMYLIRIEPDNRPEPVPAPDADLVAMDAPAPPPVTPKADATVRVVLPPAVRADPPDPRVCPPGAAMAHAVVRARVYVDGEATDREMEILLMPGTWAAP
jgi:hypothetical protein